MKVLNNSAGIYFLNHFGPDVLAAFSGREYDGTRRNDFLEQIGIQPDSLILLKQVHGTEIVRVDAGQKQAPDFEADGMMTALPKVALGIVTADCIPVFFWASDRKVIAMAHAGWRGLAGGILAKMVRTLTGDFRVDPKHIRVIFGPAIRPCCYEVGEELREKFGKFYRARHVDLPGFASEQLKQEGVLRAHLFDARICTHCHHDQFFSARREKTSERILSVLQIR